MASQVPNSQTPLPAGKKPERAHSSLETPEDYKQVLKVGRSAGCKLTKEPIDSDEGVFDAFLPYPCRMPVASLWR